MRNTKNKAEFKKVLLSSVLSKFSKTNKIFIIGNFGNGNIGDEFLLKSVLQDLSNPSRSVYASVRSELQTINDKSNFYPVEPLSYKGIKSFFKSDVLVIGPGGLFGKDIGPFAFIIPLLILLKKIFSKQVVFYGFGIYNNTNSFIKLSVKFSCLLADYVSVRDEDSLNVLKSGFPIINADLILDPVFTLSIKPPIKRSKKSDYRIGLSLRYVEDPLSRKKILEILSAGMSKKNISNCTFVPLNFYKQIELTVKRSHPSDSEMITELSKLNPDLKIANNSDLKSFDDVINTYRKLDAVVAMRFHAQVIAVMMNLPLLGIEYSPKNKFISNFPKVIYSENQNQLEAKFESFLKSI